MKCINCGANLNDGATYCIRCGSVLSDGGKSVIKVNKESNRKSLNNEDIDNLVKAYVGNKYDRFIYSGFSINYFLFGPIYGFTRRMYSFSILNLVLYWVISFIGNFINNEYFTWIGLIVLNLFFSFELKKQYLYKVKERVNKIIDKNPNLDIVMLQNICIKKGGLNLFFLIINIIYLIGIVCLLVYIILNPNLFLNRWVQ